MASDTNNVKLGVCSVTFNAVDLGYTKGGVEVEVSTDTHPVTVDQFGESEISERIIKRSVKVKVPLAETTLENLVAIMPGATLITDGTDPLKKRVDVVNAISTDLLAIAQKLVLHPIANAVDELNEDFIIPLAATAGAMNFAYKFDDERIFDVMFTAYPDSSNGDLLFQVGDENATV